MSDNEKLPAHELITSKLRGLIEEVKVLHFSLTHASKSAEAAIGFRVLLSLLPQMQLDVEQRFYVMKQLVELFEIATEYGMGEYAGELRAVRTELNTPG